MEQHASASDERRRRRRGAAWLRRLTPLLLLCWLAWGVGPSEGPLSPDLLPVSLTNPAPPTDVVVAPRDRELDVSWTAPLEASIDGYRVYVDGVLAASPGGRSARISGLVNGRSYVITVTTVTRVGGLTYEGTTASDPVSGVPRDTSAPSAPTGVSAVGGDRQVTVSWNASTAYDADGYRVLRNGTPVSGLISGAGTTTWTDTGLAADTSYTYNVQAHDTSGNWSNNSSTVTVRTLDPYPPAVPVGLAATRGENRVTLSWTANTEPDLVSYRVRRDGVEVATVPAGTTGYVDTGLTNDVTYAYTLVAVDTSGNASAPSAPPVTATPTDLTAPAMPEDLTAVPGNTRITLSWTAGTEPDLGSYRVQRDGADIATVPAGTTTYADTGLTNGTSYSYRIVAVDTHGNASPPSAARTAIPRNPAPPINVIITPKDRELEVDWTAPPEGNIDGYNVYLDGVLVASPGGRSVKISGLVNGRSYTVTVRTVIKVDNVLQEGERYSEPVSGVPRDTNPPPAPTGVTATGGDRQATVRWTAGTAYDIDGYRVLRNGVVVSGLLSGAGTTSWTDVNRPAGTYSYTVQAHDTSDNWSNSSSAASATVVDNPPAAPTGLAAVAGDGEVVLTWSANGEPDLASYWVRRDGVVVAVVTSGTGWTDTGLTNATTYAYTLVAVDAAGNQSAVSAPAVQATPTDRMPPAAPTGLTAVAGDGRVTLDWSANGEPDVASYRVLRDDVEVATVPSGTTGYVDTGLVNGTTYGYALVAVDTAGNRSPASTPAVQATPAAPATNVPGEGAGQSGGFAVSGNGRFLVVGSSARLEAADTNSAYELYLVDRTLDTTRRVHPLPGGASGMTDAVNTAAPVISDDGRYLALATTAKLVASDTNNRVDVYRLDLSTGSWALVSVPASGLVHPSVAGTLLHAGTTASSPSVVMTADGGTVLFYSERPDLVAGDTNGVADVFAKDMTTGAVTRVSTTEAGADLIGVPTGPALAVTPDGRTALFTHLTGGVTKLYRKTLTGAGTGDLTVLSTRRVGGSNVDFGVNRDAGDVAISDDGRYVALVTTAKVSPPVSGTWTAALAYRLDTTTGTFARLGTGQTTTLEHRVELDPTGRYGFFSTTHASLGDTNGHSDFFRRDLDTGTLALVTADATGNPTNGPLGPVASSEYGRLFATSGSSVLMTTSQALLTADTNRIRDVYAKDLVSGAVGSPLG